MDFSLTEREAYHRDRVRAFMRVYLGGWPADVQVKARITDAADRIAADTTATLAASRFTGRNAADFTYELPVASLGHGNYVVSIESRLDAKTTVIRSVRFAVR